jgi:hypothetical protein
MTSTKEVFKVKFTKLPKLIDYRNKLIKHSWKKYKEYGVNVKTHIAIHHSLTKTGSAESYAGYHVNEHGWPAIAYHFVIEKDGTIKWCHNLGILSYHVGDSNMFTVGICLTGDFRYQQPTKEQYESLYKLVIALMDDLHIPVENVWGHQEYKKYLWKQCPALNMDQLRGNIFNRNYVPVENNFNNDDMILVPKGVDDKLKIEEWQWEMLEGAMTELVEKKVLNSPEWIDRAKKRDLSISELSWLNLIILSRK